MSTSPTASGAAARITIDGSHQYPDVSADLDHYLPMLRPGGLVWMHDMHPPYTGPKQALEEAVAARDDVTLEAMYETDAVLKKADPWKEEEAASD